MCTVEGVVGCGVAKRAEGTKDRERSGGGGGDGGGGGQDIQL